MLVLSRKKSEKIVVEVPGYPPVAIIVVEIRGDKVRIGVEADKQINVNREEIHNLGLTRDEAKAAKADNPATLAKPAIPVTMADFVKGRAS